MSDGYFVKEAIPGKVKGGCTARLLSELQEIRRADGSAADLIEMLRYG